MVLLVPRAIAQTNMACGHYDVAADQPGGAAGRRAPSCCAGRGGSGWGRGCNCWSSATVPLIPALAVVIVIFLLLWRYVLRTRRQLLATPSGWRMLIS